MKERSIGAVWVIVGVALGAALFRGGPVGAQSAPYRECVAGHQESHDINNQGLWDRQERGFDGDRKIRIPDGWELAGTGGGIATNNRTYGILVICRR